MGLCLNTFKSRPLRVLLVASPGGLPGASAVAVAADKQSPPTPTRVKLVRFACLSLPTSTVIDGTGAAVPVPTSTFAL